MAPEQYSKRRLVPRRKIQGEAVAQNNFHSKGLAPKILGYCNFKPKKRLRKSAHERLNDLGYDDDDRDRVSPPGPFGLHHRDGGDC